MGLYAACNQDSMMHGTSTDGRLDSRRIIVLPAHVQLGCKKHAKLEELSIDQALKLVLRAMRYAHQALPVEDLRLVLLSMMEHAIACTHLTSIKSGVRCLLVSSGCRLLQGASSWRQPLRRCQA